MSATTEENLGSLATPPRRRRRLAISIVLIVAVVGAGAGLWNAGVIGGPNAADDKDAKSETTADATARVTKRDLAAHTKVDATLGYSGNYPVINRARGTITTLPKRGQVIKQGQALYSVDGTPVPLLHGAIPAYRPLAVGDSGIDVQQLNAALVALGYDSTGELDPKSDDYDWSTRAAVKNLQEALDIDPTGRIAEGSIVFLPTAARITNLAATLGGAAQPGQPVLTASSTKHQVEVPLDVDLQSHVKVGDSVTITLPDGDTTKGSVTSVGSVANPAKDGNSGSDSQPDATIEVLITPKEPAKLGTLDQAPVQVSITTDQVRKALVVPVAALLARPGGAYAVEVVGADGIHHLVDVTLGLVDDADGLVAVSGAGLAAGQTIVVPQS